MAEPLSAQDARRILREYIITQYLSDPQFAQQGLPQSDWMTGRPIRGLAQKQARDRAQAEAEAYIAKWYPNTAEGDIAAIGQVTERLRNLDPKIILIAEVIPAAASILKETRDNMQQLAAEARTAQMRTQTGLTGVPTPAISPPGEIAGLTPITPSPTPNTTQITLDMVKRMMEEPSYGLSLLLDASNALSGTKAGTAEFLAAQARISSLGVIFDTARKLQAEQDKKWLQSQGEQERLDKLTLESLARIEQGRQFDITRGVTERGQDITKRGQDITAQTSAERLQLDTERERQRIIEAQQTLQADITKTLSERQRDAATVGANLQPYKLPSGTEYNPGFEPNSLMAQQAGSVGLQYSPMRTSPIGVDPYTGVRTIQDYLARLGQSQTVQ